MNLINAIFTVSKCEFIACMIHNHMDNLVQRVLSASFGSKRAAMTAG